MCTAYISNEGRYTIFSYDNVTLKFIGPYSLEKYDKVLEWDNGYLVVLTKYFHNEDLEEEYIDLIPVLNELNMDVDKFLEPIQKVEVKYD